MSFSAASNSEREARKQLSRYSCLDDFFSSLQSCSNIVIISGAGISVPCGIPDFRSVPLILPLFTHFSVDQKVESITRLIVRKLASRPLNCYLICASLKWNQVFPILFPCSPHPLHSPLSISLEPFYKYAKNLLPSQSTLPSLSHHLISYLESQNKLLRNYTQNFDGLEAVAGVTRFLQSHGTIQKFKCLKCRKKVELDEAIREEIEKGEVPYCDCGGVMVFSLTPLLSRFPSYLPFYCLLEAIDHLLWRAIGQ
jgi:NAD+-dependent protein deacetylase SIR2